MENQTNDKKQMTIHKEFWDSLKFEISDLNHKLTHADLYAFIEQNFMFSQFFRSCSLKELMSFQNLFQIKDSAYLIILELFSPDKSVLHDIETNPFEFYHFLKDTLSININNAIGPFISNRINILISEDPERAIVSNTKIESLHIARTLIDALQKKYRVYPIAGIGNIQDIKSVYTSYIEALTCMPFCEPGHAIHVDDLVHMEQDFYYEYAEAEKHMIEAIRLRKNDAYDFFCILMNYNRSLSDHTKRIRIIEALILSAHAARMDGMNNVDYFDYTKHFDSIMKLKGNELIEWAYQRFFVITGFVKTHNSIDYSNKIVQSTKEYLESHYSEDISLEDVAEQANISPQYFSKLIKKNTGFNFIDWLSMLRVKKAKELLSNSNYTVKEVCFMVGYKDPNYFSRIFKKRIGITPSEYVKNKTNISNTN